MYFSRIHQPLFKEIALKFRLFEAGRTAGQERPKRTKQNGLDCVHYYEIQVPGPWTGNVDD
jgi:hypothetical protein